MLNSQGMRRLGLCGSLCLVTAACWAWAEPQEKGRGATTVDPLNATATTESTSSQNADGTRAKSSRIEFEANWKNVQVGTKPLYFQQGNKAFVWTVKNTGSNPVVIGDDYGFTIEPGSEDFIVDLRLNLTAVDGKPTTVDVKASRVMTQSELTQQPQPTPAGGPVYNYAPVQPFGPSANVPSFPGEPYNPSAKAGSKPNQSSTQPTF